MFLHSFGGLGIPTEPCPFLPSATSDGGHRRRGRRLETGKSPARAFGRSKRVLVVDDEHIVADSVAEILNRNGFEAVAVYNGADAVEHAREFRPDIVLADVVMPDKNGIDTAFEIARSLPKVRVVLFSGQAETADLLEAARQRGCSFELLPKPVHPRELLMRLKT